MGLHLLDVAREAGLDQVDGEDVHRGHVLEALGLDERAGTAVQVGVHVVLLLGGEPGEVAPGGAVHLGTERLGPAEPFALVAFLQEGLPQNAVLVAAADHPKVGVRLAQCLPKHLQVSSVSAGHDDQEAVVIRLDFIEAVIEVVADDRPGRGEAFLIGVVRAVINDRRFEIDVPQDGIQEVTLWCAP